RVPRPPGEQRALLRRQWQKALAHVQDAGPGADPTFSARCAPLVAAVTAGQARAGAARGRWARPGGPSDARVLAALALLTLQAVRPEVEADIRRLGELAGVCRETARRALGRLAAEGWIAQTAAAAGIHAARWRLNAPSTADSTPPAGTGVSQAVPRPHPTQTHPDPDPDPDPDPVLQRQAWLHALHRRLHQLAHDLWTPTGLGQHAARLHAALTDAPQSPRQLAEHTGYRCSAVEHHLERLHDIGLARPDDRGWRRGPLTDTHRGDLADRLGVAGILTRRRQRHRAERKAWAWWGEELTWMRAPRPHPDLPHPAASLRSLPGPTHRRRYGRHPRRPNRRADFAAALTTLTAAAPHTATAA
ncbi:MAG: ArsR family transcriptional regulator, partial [Geodermatophilales bacterium]|nr:ArsR family transcriptional regulator [Geodermatophilales bacterium]